MIALSGFFNGRKTVSRLRPLNDIKIYTEIFGSDFQGFTEIFRLYFTPKVAGPDQSEV